MERPLIASGLKGKFDVEYPGWWDWYRKFNNWLASLFDVSTNAFKPPHLADANAPNDSVYYSTTASKLVYKDALGAIHNLW